MRTREKTLLILFAGAAAVHLLSTLWPSQFLLFLSKPLLLLSLLLAWQSLPPSVSRFSRLITGAFLFSWFGDILLMLVGIFPNIPFFIFGLAAFLVAHLFFIAAFWSWKGDRQGLIQQRPWLLLPFLALWAILVYVLWPGLGALKIPVVLYSLVIIGMTASAHNLWRLTIPQLSNGTLLFVLSDSLIALNKFHSPIPLASFWIMLTYILAQYLIYQGAKACVYQEMVRSVPLEGQGNRIKTKT